MNKTELQKVVTEAVAISKKALMDNYGNLQGKDNPKVVGRIAEKLIEHALRDQDEYGVLDAFLEEEEDSGSESVQILQKDEKGKPKLVLTPQLHKLVYLPTQNDYWDLMKIYECGGWKWITGVYPTHYNNWISLGEETCISIGDNFTSKRRAPFQPGTEQITPQKFYDIQGITPEMLKKVKDYFDGLER